MGFISIFFLATMPVLRVLILCALGAFLASSYIDVLTEDARKNLNTLVLIVFTPALVFYNLAQSVTLANMMAWWYLPVNVLVVFILGGGIGWLVVRICKPEPHLRQLTIACCSAGNVGNLLLILVPAACTEPNSPFGEASACITNGVAYVSFGLWMAVLLLWTLIYRMLLPPALGIHDDFSRKDSGRDKNDCHKDCRTDGEEELRLLEIPKMQQICAVHKESMAESEQIMNALSSKSSFDDKDLVDVQLTPHGPGPTSRLLSFGREAILFHLKRFAVKSHLQQLLNPPMVAVVIALFVGATPPIKRLLIGKAAPLRFIEEALVLLGNAMIPSMNLLLGGNLSQGLGSTKIKASIIAGIVSTRLLILPVMGIAIVRGASQLGLLPQDPLFHFVLMMQFTMPTAMTIGTITQHFGTGEKESSVILFWCYMIATVAITSWTMLYMWLLL